MTGTVKVLGLLIFFGRFSCQIAPVIRHPVFSCDGCPAGLFRLKSIRCLISLPHLQPDASSCLAQHLMVNLRIARVQNRVFDSASQPARSSQSSLSNSCWPINRLFHDPQATSSRCAVPACQLNLSPAILLSGSRPYWIKEHTNLEYIQFCLGSMGFGCGVEERPAKPRLIFETFIYLLLFFLKSLLSPSRTICLLVNE